jgi:hypothetical protein
VKVDFEGDIVMIALRSSKTSKTEQEGTSSKIKFTATGSALCPVGLLNKVRLARSLARSADGQAASASAVRERRPSRALTV